MQTQIKKKHILITTLTVAGALFYCGSSAHADTIYAAGTAAGPSGTAPGLANSDNTATEQGSWETWIGGADWVSSGSVQTSVIMGFQLPSLGAVNDPFASATLGVNYFKSDFNPTFNVDLYGLGVRDNSDIAGSDYYGGSLDTTAGVTLLQSSFITPSTLQQTVDGPVGTFSQDIASYLNLLYADGANAGKFVIFRFNADVTGLENDTSGTDGGADVVYHIETNPGNGTPDDLPQINYATVPVPEPSTIALCSLAMAALVIRRRR